MRGLFLKSLVLWGWISTVGAGAIPIVLTDAGGAAPGTPAGDAFLAAAARVGALFSDPITVNINVSFADLGTSILGQTSVSPFIATYSAVRTAFIGDQTSALDVTATASLPVGPLTFFTNANNGSRFFDNNNTNNNNFLQMTQANARALGLFSGAGSDGSITFNSNPIFNFDFDPSDGINPGAFDYVGVATHEILHVLGFFSGVDSVDVLTGAGPAAGSQNLNNLAILTPLDLYRYSATGVREISTAGTQYFSINGGSTNLGGFSTGAFNGNGSQASHWQNGQGLGLMNPTLAAGTPGVLSQLDINAMDVIGYNLALPGAPELVAPAALLPMTFALVGLLSLNRRHRPSRR